MNANRKIIVSKSTECLCYSRFYDTLNLFFVFKDEYKRGSIGMEFIVLNNTI